MRRFLENWNYKKHAAAISAFYVGLVIIGNAFFGKKVAKDEKSLNPINIGKQMTKKQWILNGILFGCYSIDMTATYCALKHLKKQYK